MTVVSLACIYSLLPWDCGWSQHSKVGQYYRYFLFPSTLFCSPGVPVQCAPPVHQHLRVNLYVVNCRGTRCGDPKCPTSELREWLHSLRLLFFFFSDCSVYISSAMFAQLIAVTAHVILFLVKWRWSHEIAQLDTQAVLCKLIDRSVDFWKR